jgi:hypothetical protein
MKDPCEEAILTFGPATDDEEQSRKVINVASTRLLMAKAWVAIIAVGIATGFVVWELGEWALHSFAPTYKMTSEKIFDRRKSTAEIGRQRRLYGTQVAIITYGALGAALGLALGLAGGSLRGLFFRGLNAGLAGLIFGAVSTAAVAKFAVPLYYRAFDASSDKLAHDMLLPFIIHAAIWICAGTAGGGSLGLGLGSWSVAFRGALGGGLGALLGTVIYEVAGALLFTMAGTAQPLAEQWEPRMIALLSVTILVSIMAFWATGFPRSAEMPSPDQE